MTTSPQASQQYPRLVPISYHSSIITDTPDIPVDLQGYERNVKKCKALIGIFSILSILSNAAIIATSVPSGASHALGLWEGLNWGFQLSALSVLSLSLLPRLDKIKLGNESRDTLTRICNKIFCHPSTCLVLSILTLAPVSRSLVQVYRSNPIFYSFPPTSQESLLLFSVCFNIASFLASGIMRRRPKLYYQVPPMQLGSGLRATPEEEDEGLRLWLAGEEGGVEPEANVLDYDGCGLLSLLLGTYVSPLWRKSWSQPQLNETDLLQLPYRNRAQGVALEDVLDSQIAAAPDRAAHHGDGRLLETSNETFTPWGLLYHVWRRNLGLVLWGMSLISFGVILDFTPKLLDRQVIRLFETGAVKTPEGRQWGYLMIFGATALRVCGFAVYNYSSFLENYHLHGRVRIKLEQMLYAKLLRTHDPRYLVGEKQDPEGDKAQDQRKLQLVTLLGNDMRQVCSFAAWICFGVVEVVFGFGVPFAYLVYLLGWSAIASLAAVVALTPIVRYFSRSVYRMSRKIPVERDKRISVVREMLQSVTAVKLNAWEDPFMQKATNAREQELQAIRTSKLADAVLSTFDRWIPMLAIWLAFMTHTVIRHKPFPASTALIAPKIFGGAFQSLLKGPKVLNRGFSLYVSCERMSTYLNSADIRNDKSECNTTVLRSVVATWRNREPSSDTAPSFRLSDVSVTFVPNSLNVVAGPLASGKSLLLLAILGEATILQGQVEAPRSSPDTVPGLGYSKTEASTDLQASWLQPSIAYTPQVAFIEHGTVRSNIVFGQLFWKDRYEEVIWACCLQEDIASWPDGDMTELGEGGHVISGGQQSRINLARTLYSRAQTLLIDDPLSAVDNTTAKHIIKYALSGDLVKSRTVILTTHHVSLCAPYAMQVVHLEEGKVSRSLDRAQLAFSEEATSWNATSGSIPDPAPRVTTYSKEEVSGGTTSTRDARQLIKAEERKAGVTGRKHLLSLLKTAGGVEFWSVLLIVFVVSECLGIAHSAWLAEWTLDSSDQHNRVYAFGSIAITTARGLVMFLSSALAIFAFTWRASASVHQRLLSALLRAPLQILQAIPTGRILNRFTSDMEQFDMNLASVARDTLKMSLGIIVMLGSTAFQVPQILWVVLALSPIFYNLQWRFAKFLSDAKKLNSIWTSPLLTMMNDSQRAVTVIRAFGSVNASATRMRLLQSQQRIAGLSEFAAWLLCRASLQGVGIAIPTATGIAILHRSNQTAAWAGFTLSIIQFVTQAIYDLVMQVGNIDTSLVTVERLQEYSQLPSEPETDCPTLVPSEWPTSGHLQVEKLSAAYDHDLPDVLHDVSFEVKPAERVGVVGRTGHGKSTLALCLLRALQYMRGSIKIDGIDTNKLYLRDLRGRISLIPQEAVLTSGTLRQALDINEEHSDAELHAVLKCVHLVEGDSTEARPQRFADLEQVVTSGGENFSRGERQLMALARALLKRSKLLIMDEATSSIDQDMDEKIRQTIKHSFAGVTMLVIAHRLATVMDFDKVLVMAEGRVVEYDRPSSLLQNVDSELYKLCATHGEEELDKLKRLAGL